MQFEPSIRVIPSGLGVVVDDRHCNVAQVHIGYVDIRIFIPQLTSDVLQQGRFPDAGLTTQQEPSLWVGANQCRGLLQGHGLTKFNF